MISLLPQHAPLVVTTRGEAIECVHYGSIAVAGAAGRLLYSVGDCEYPVFTRSTLKPFQALPFVADEGPRCFDFSPEQIALMCASHSGETRHTDGVAEMLEKVGCSVGELLCGTHAPLYYAACGLTPPSDAAFNALHHNCSGKHAGFLAYCRQHHLALESYLDPQHTLQREIRAAVATIAGLSEANLVAGIDGCGAPNYAIPLRSLARAYARLAAPPEGGRYGAALATLFDAMTAHPEMVAGERRNDVMFMRIAPGDWVVKGGAEGVQALGMRSTGLGIAIKIADGAARAVQTATAAVLDQLGMLRVEPAHEVRKWLDAEIRNYAGRPTGRVSAVFKLEAAVG